MTQMKVGKLATSRTFDLGNKSYLSDAWISSESAEQAGRVWRRKEVSCQENGITNCFLNSGCCQKVSFPLGIMHVCPSLCFLLCSLMMLSGCWQYCCQAPHPSVFPTQLSQKTTKKIQIQAILWNIRTSSLKLRLLHQEGWCYSGQLYIWEKDKGRI